MIRKSCSSWSARIGLVASWIALWAVDVAALEQGGGSFWSKNKDAILVGIIVGVVVSILSVIFSEPIKAAFRRFGAWVDRWFGSLGLRFEKLYLEALSRRHCWLQLIGVYSRADLHPPRLREVFVSLRMATSSDEDCPRVAWSEAFSDPRGRIVVLGPPGSGKSTLMSYLVLVMTGVAPHVLRRRLGRPLPLFGRLREAKTENGSTSVLDLFRGATRLKVPKGYFERRLAKGGCVVLLDGLDEVLDEDLHREVVEQVDGLQQEYPENLYVVTCRIAGWRNQLPGWKAFEVQPFTDDDVHQLISVWYREVLRTEHVNRLGLKPSREQLEDAEEESSAEALARSDSLRQSLHQSQGLMRIARTPLILSLITLVHYHRVTDLPKGRAKLYQQCLEILLDLWDRQDKRLAVAGPSLKDKLLVLRTIAYRFLEDDLIEADLAIIEKMVQPVIGSLARPMTAEELVDIIWRRSGILVEQAIGRYGFAHRALLDYLAATFLVEEQLDEALLDRASEERWREVILIAIGLAGPERAKSLMRGLIDREGAGLADLEIAGHSLGEDLQIGQDLRAEVCHRLRVRLESGEDSSAFARVFSALRAADLEMAVHWMADVLRGRNPELRSRVMSAIPELGDMVGSETSPILFDVLTSPDEAAETRVNAALAIAAVAHEPDAARWAQLETTRRDPEPMVRRAATWAWCELGRFEELGLVQVPAGEFIMGDNQQYFDERPKHRLFLPTFYIGKTPVTVDQLKRFVGEGGFIPEDDRCLGGVSDHPATFVGWKEAVAFASWHGLRLPSEAEWEKAARGTDGRVYPWGDEWKPGVANTLEYYNRGWSGLYRRLARFRRGRTMPVGLFSPGGDSPYGCVDMCGNVCEWTRSLIGSYPYDAGDGREDADSSETRVVRGGAFGFYHHYARCSFRSGGGPYRRGDLIGFRVVAAPFTLSSDPSGL